MHHKSVYTDFAYILTYFSVIYVNGTEMEISVNRKILIPLTETKTETKKLRKTETKWKQKNLTRKLINFLAMSIFVSVVFPFRAIVQVLCNVIR